MKKIYLVLLLVLVSLHAVIAQTKNIIIRDAVSKEPIPNVSVQLENKNAGTISQNDGVARISNSIKGTLHLSHINYLPTSLQAENIKDDYTIYLTPRSAQEIEEVVIKLSLDIRWVGKWKLHSSRTLWFDKNGIQTSASRSFSSNNIKEYKADRTFVITNNNKTFLYGQFTTNRNQVFEEIIFAKDRFLEGITNILTYRPQGENRKMIVQYQLPNQKSITEEIWEKID